MELQTKYTKGQNGWRGVTYIKLDLPPTDDGQPFLKISTSKAFSGGLYTVAQSIYRNDFSEVSTIGGGEYQAYPCRNHMAARVTEKTVMIAHQSIIEHAQTHYDLCMAHLKAQVQS